MQKCPFLRLLKHNRGCAGGGILLPTGQRRKRISVWDVSRYRGQRGEKGEKVTFKLLIGNNIFLEDIIPKLFGKNSGHPSAQAK